MTTAKDIQLIHIAKQSLGMDDATYRGVLARYSGGKTSSKELSWGELQQVLRHMRACGFKVKAKPGSKMAEADPQALKLRALWWALADAEAVQRPANAAECDAAIEAWAKRQMAGRIPKLDALRFASGDQMRELIEQLKQWGRRVKANVD